jgi:hypothetical protein
MRQLRLVLAILVLLIWSSVGVRAAELQDRNPAPQPQEITTSEFQGLSCLVGGTFGGLAAWTYSEIFLAGAIAGSSLPVVIPVVATAFVAGCGVGSVMAPGLLWIYRRT